MKISRNQLANAIIVLAALSIPVFLICVHLSEKKFYRELSESYVPRENPPKSAEQLAAEEPPMRYVPAVSDNPKVYSLHGNIFISEGEDSYVCFEPDADGGIALTGDASMGDFCFTNQEQARQWLKVDPALKLNHETCPYIRGEANIVINNYSGYEPKPGEISSAKLLKVPRIISPTNCKADVT